ncbi:CBS domain-containing protein [Parapedobacter lycopersici]|uniref:CBS domain-containing protein n=1 Tax=Parapedobacter lycopersici TaxID=1864939 RepID=UPI00214D9407|nr:CBS domain-containing protein [Parapedobacter lycopersici]
MKTVKQILKAKPDIVHSVTPEVSVYDALKMMMEKNISALLVIESGHLLGIFTERDYARKIILQGKSSKETAIHEVMTKDPHTITRDETTDYCMQLMTHRHFRHLPVVEGATVIGMLSIGDLVKHIIEDQQQTINQLENYINS